ncbi:MAG: hypothetical protein PUB51_00605 [Oscillospiraceae bacterium]|nr:hypothetical protein [Oscillospiraceae bacterium]
MEFLLGLLGALTAGLLFGSGIFVGRRLPQLRGRERAGEQNEEERQRLMQEQEAFRLLQNYTPERAYGQALDQREA